MRDCSLIELKSLELIMQAWRQACEVVSRALGLCVRRGAARGAGRRKPCGVCAARVGSCRRLSPGPEVCCTPRPPPRSRRPLRPGPRGWPVWSWALRRSSSSTWCVGSETTPEHNTLLFVSVTDGKWKLKELRWSMTPLLNDGEWPAVDLLIRSLSLLRHHL